MNKPIDIELRPVKWDNEKCRTCSFCTKRTCLNVKQNKRFGKKIGFFDKACRYYKKKTDV